MFYRTVIYGKILQNQMEFNLASSVFTFDCSKFQGTGERWRGCFKSFNNFWLQKYIEKHYISYAPPAISMSVTPSTPLKKTRNFLSTEVFVSFLLVVPVTWIVPLEVLPIRSKSGRFRFDRVISSSTGGACIYRLLPWCVTLAFDNSRSGCFSSSSMNCAKKKKK